MNPSEADVVSQVKKPLKLIKLNQYIYGAIEFNTGLLYQVCVKSIN
jgi:hypothetical protein